MRSETKQVLDELPDLSLFDRARVVFVKFIEALFERLLYESKLNGVERGNYELLGFLLVQISVVIDVVLAPDLFNRVV